MTDERKNVIGLNMLLRKNSNHKTEGREIGNMKQKEKKQTINPRSLVSE